MYSVDTIVLTFFIYSVLGWICEVIYCSVPKKRFVNRGFLYGPYLPIYGFGATIVIVVLTRFMEHWYLVFIFGVILTSILEYFTSFLLEKIFSVKLWDYSNYPLNINGRVCALNSTLFGLLSLFIMYVVNEPVYHFLTGLNSTLLEILSLLVVAVMSADCAFSVSKMAQFQKAILELSQARAEIEERMRIARESVSSQMLEKINDRIKADIENVKASYYGKARHFFKSNPSLTVRREDLRKPFEFARETYDSVTQHRHNLRMQRKAEKKGDGNARS